MPYQVNNNNTRGAGRPFVNSRQHYSNDDTNMDPESEQFRKLFVGGLSYETTDKSLKEYFSQSGEITDCVVMKDAHTKRSRGFGFVTFRETAMLEEVQRQRKHKVDGRDVETKRAMPREFQSHNRMNHTPVTKMFVGGLREDTTEEMVRQTFSGHIKKVHIIRNRVTGKSRGFCFIDFDDPDDVDKHVLRKRFDLNGRRVEVKKAVSKDDMTVNRSFYHPVLGYPAQNYGLNSGYFPGLRAGYGPSSYANHGYGNSGQAWNHSGGYGDSYYGNQGGWNGYYPGPQHGVPKGGYTNGGAAYCGSGGFCGGGGYGGGSYGGGSYGGGSYGGGSNYGRR